MISLENCPLCDSREITRTLTSKDFFLTHESFNIDSCDSCGFKFTNPRPSAKELNKYYESIDYISHSNESKGIVSLIYQAVRQYTLRAKLRLIEKHLDKTNGIKHLDFGCGTGHFVDYASKKGWKSIGFEPDQRINKKHNHLIINSLNDSFSSSPFDVITLFHVLEHVDKLNPTIAQLLTLLKPNGLLILALPNPNSFDAKYYKEHWAGYDLPRHLYHFTQSSVTTLSEKHGIKIEYCKPMRFDSYYVSLLSEKYLKSKFRFIRAFFRGIKSNLSARGNMEYSSLIYILRK
jgi:SAM-dependent methyltransferase